jgi:hypothetical protein
MSPPHSCRVVSSCLLSRNENNAKLVLLQMKRPHTNLAHKFIARNINLSLFLSTMLLVRPRSFEVNHICK